MKNTKLAALLRSYQGKHIAVLGLGVSNRPLVRLLLGAGCHVTGCDRTPREKLEKEVLELEEMGCTLSLGDTYLDGIRADIVFRTPGMHPDIPALRSLREAGAQVTSEMEIFFECCPCHLIAVTGSDGKTTTTTLIAKMLEAAGKTVWLGGNIGTPLLPRIEEMSPADYAVVELSSFQLMDMRRSPAIAVITNLAPNHLDVHKDMAEYIQAKQNVYAFQDASGRLILNADNAITASLQGNGQTLFFSRQKQGDACVRDGIIYLGDRAVLDTADILIPGVHNIENYMAAILAVQGLVDDETVRTVAKTFGGVEHRIELVRIKDGVRFYNDSIASSPSRTIAGLRSFREKVLLIAGGYDKHIPYDVLGPEICQHVKKLYLNGATAPQIRATVEACDAAEKPEMVDCGDFETAVRTAAADAAAGDIVLMSPASAAFDQFKNFMVRGNFYKQLVKEL